MLVIPAHAGIQNTRCPVHSGTTTAREVIVTKYRSQNKLQIVALPTRRCLDSGVRRNDGVGGCPCHRSDHRHSGLSQHPVPPTHPSPRHSGERRNPEQPGSRLAPGRRQSDKSVTQSRPRIHPPVIPAYAGIQNSLGPGPCFMHAGAGPRRDDEGQRRPSPSPAHASIARHSGEVGYAGKPRSGCSQSRNPEPFPPTQSIARHSGETCPGMNPAGGRNPGPFPPTP
jgi:hypothetical protein